MATAALQRTYLVEKGPSGLPRILVVFDAVTQETPEFTAAVTEHPVEEGPEVSDHIQLKNPTLQIVGTISNTPIDLQTTIGNLLSGGIAAVTSSQFRDNVLNSGVQQISAVAGAKLLGASASQALGDAVSGAADAIARSALLDAYERRARFDVVTKRYRYESMVIERLSFPRDPQTGRQVVFELEMKRIRIVSAFTVQIENLAENVVNSATPVAALGNQVTKGVTPQVASSASGVL